MNSLIIIILRSCFLGLLVLFYICVLDISGLLKSIKSFGMSTKTNLFLISHKFWSLYGVSVIVFLVSVDTHTGSLSLSLSLSLSHAETHIHARAHMYI